MKTRLERLVDLLESGSSRAIRSTAAQQLGEFVRIRPSDLPVVLERVRLHLHSKKWETRLAAALAVEHMARHAPPWRPEVSVVFHHPQEPHDLQQVKSTTDQVQESSDGLRIAQLDWKQILRQGDILVGSAGREFDSAAHWAHMDPKERLQAQKRDIQSRLGLGSEFLNDLQLIGEDDVAPTASSSSSTIGIQVAKDNIANQIGLAEGSHLSARERARLRRKARLDVQAGRSSGGATLISTASGGLESATQEAASTANALRPLDTREQTLQDLGGQILQTLQVPQRAALEPVSTAPSVVETVDVHLDDTKLVLERVPSSQAWLDLDEWPFASFCESLLIDLFDPMWEIRHGAALGLREIMRHHAAQAGHRAILVLRHEVKDQLHAEQLVEETQAQQNQAWLEDVCVRLLCIFALDRFSDFEGDHVVVPVRETCAQTLSLAVKQMRQKHLVMALVHQGLLELSHAGQLVEQLDSTTLWGLQLGCALALKYILAIRKDMVDSFLSSDVLLQSILKGLRNSNDDIRATTASMLVPIADDLVQRVSSQHLVEIVGLLWDCLLDLDDLSSSTASVMELLGSLYQIPNVPLLLQSQAEWRVGEGRYFSFTADTFEQQYLVRLFPLFRHTVLSVRLTTLETIATLIPTLSGAASQQTGVLFLLLEHIFQNFLLEEKHDLLDKSLHLWQAVFTQIAARHDWLAWTVDDLLSELPRWLSLLTTPIGTALHVERLPVAGKVWNRDMSVLHRLSVSQCNLSAQDAAMIQQDFEVHDIELIKYGRYQGAKAVAYAVSSLKSSEQLTREFIQSCLVYQAANNVHGSVFPAQVFGMVIEEWAKLLLPPEKITNLVSYYANGAHHDLVENLAQSLLACISNVSSIPEPYAEMGMMQRLLRMECTAILQAVVSQLQVDSSALPSVPEYGFTTQDALMILDNWIPSLLASKPGMTLKSDVLQGMDTLKLSIRKYREAADTTLMPTISAYMSAYIVVDDIFRQNEKPKLNPLLKALMNGIKYEHIEWLQKKNASTLARFILILYNQPDQVWASKITSKIVRNLTGFLCVDSSVTPLLEQSVFRTKEPLIFSFEEFPVQKSEDELKELRNIVRGARFTLESIFELFRDDVFSLIPVLWDVIQEGIDCKENPSNDANWTVDGQKLINSLHILTNIAPFLNKKLLIQYVSVLLPRLFNFVTSPYPIIRFMICKCIASLFGAYLKTRVKTPDLTPSILIINNVLPLLGDSTSVTNRLGAAELIWQLLQTAEVNVLSYLVFLLVPVLGRMSDQHDIVRNAVTRSFALMVRLMPLEASTKEPDDLPHSLLEKRKTERHFITQLLDPTKLEPYRIAVPIKAELRKYQQDGVNWLGFLNKYQLHGILCDDMGLGKTLQTICIMASSHYLRSERYVTNQSPDNKPLPSLVVCPTSVTGHWHHEILQFTDNLKPIIYSGSAAERKNLVKELSQYSVIVTSYEILRNDVGVFQNMFFNYCVLDEGHIIKNAKSKITLSVKSIRANHRLILSGTPIQNNVLELWSLFDFLMPGFLGTEKMFSDRFSKPIAAMKQLGGKLISVSKGAKGSKKNAANASKIKEAGTMALESLHRQVLPFLMRRMKEEVLSDLPPKIIQDYYCELSGVQKFLYDEFTKQHLSTVQSEIAGDSTNPKNGSHVFQALQYLRKLCNHPSLVVNSEHPYYRQIMEIARDEVGPQANLREIQFSPKLLALQEILQGCGIGITKENSEEEEDLTATPHRALIFCQLKSMVDFIEFDLFKKYMPSVTYLRLDGTTDASKRHSIVSQFNSDPSIDVLLLTTNVGGLGLNLTGADTVIFVEHDWNPMKDLQAMDRAHRLGQKRVVNVYRLITKNTLEDKIMGLQRFKLNIANTVINQENAGSGLLGMGHEEILDLFHLGEGKKDKRAHEGEEGSSQKRKKYKEMLGGVSGLGAGEALLSGLENTSGQYEEEFDFSKFMSKT